MLYGQANKNMKMKAPTIAASGSDKEWMCYYFDANTQKNVES